MLTAKFAMMMKPKMYCQAAVWMRERAECCGKGRAVLDQAEAPWGAGLGPTLSSSSLERLVWCLKQMAACFSMNESHSSKISSDSSEKMY
jgi:hypothetical protein